MVLDAGARADDERDVATLTLGTLDNPVCTITNTATPARLTLKKVVENNGIGTKTVADFTLSAARTAQSPGSLDGGPIEAAQPIKCFEGWSKCAQCPTSSIGRPLPFLFAPVALPCP